MYSTTLLTLVLPLLSCAFALPNPSPLSKRQNSKELAYCASIRPAIIRACVTSYSDSRTALTAAQDHFPDNSLSDGPGDAFRHCYWNALMTVHLGAAQAKVFGDLHEEGSEDTDPLRKAMDLANNEHGRNFGQEGGDVEAKCDAAAREGRLVTICGGTGQAAC